MLCAAIPAGINAFAAGDVTRAEWVSQLVAAFDMTVENDDNMPDNYFSDISEDMPYYRDILLAVEFGVINIEAGEPFRPDEPATREFATQTLNSCLLFQLGEGESHTFSESGSVTYPDDIQVAINRGWFKLSGNNFMPDQAVTTAEMTAMLSDAKAVLASEVIDENHQNTFEFAPGVIEIPQTANTSIAADNTVTIIDYDPKIKAGDIFVVYTSSLPVALKATNVTSDGNTTIISAASEGAEDAITSADAEGVIDVDLENIEAPEPVTYQVYNTVTAASEDFTVEAAGFNYDKNTNTLYATYDFKVGGSTAGTLSATLNNLKTDYKVNVFSGIYSASVAADTKLNATVEFDIASLAGIPKNITLAEVPIFGFGRIGLNAEIAIDGGVSMTWEGKIKTGFSYKRGEGWNFKKDFKKKNFSFVAHIDLKIGLRLSAGVNLLEIAKGEIYATCGAKASYKYNDYGNGSPRVCETLKGYMYATVGYSIDIVLVDSKSDSIDIFDESNSPIRVVYHYEDGKLVSTCSRGEDLSYTTSPWSRYFNPYYGQGSYGDGGTAEPIIIWEYEVDEEGNATITKYYGNASAVAIPETIDGYTVTKIGWQAFAENTLIQSVILPSSVIEIESGAFADCMSLNNITFSKNLEEIGVHSFINCESLANITLPKSLQSAWNAFSYSGIKSAVFEDGTTAIADSILANSEKLVNVTIPDSVVKIDNSAFSNCVSLQYINLPDTITEIGTGVFSGCTNLSQFELPRNIDSMGAQVFANCDALTEIMIPKSLTTAWNTFAYSGIKTAVFENGITVIPNSIFATSEKLEFVEIPDSVVKIEDNAFDKCKAMQSINIPDTVTEIGGAAFYDCIKLNSFVLPKYIERMGASVFANCKSLTEIKIPKSLTYTWNTFSYSGIKSVRFEEGREVIPESIFSNAENLEDIKIPDSIKLIGSDAFNNCKSLPAINLPDALEEIGFNAFSGCSTLKEVSIPENIITIGGYTFSECTNIEKVKLPSTIKTITAGMFNKCEKLTDIQIPKTVTDIQVSAFSQCSSLKEITLPEELETLGDSVFYECSSLNKINLSKNVESIGKNAFYNCDSLVAARIEASNYIGFDLFYDCDALTTLELDDGVREIGYEMCYGCDSLKDVKLGKYITTIPDSAFRLCQSLETINIPRFCETIESNAFAEDTKLKTAYIPTYISYIDNNSFSYPAKMTVYGKSGSYAEEYAKSRNIIFNPINAVITNINFLENKTDVEINKEFVLPMNITPEFDADTITFSSSDENVATISENGVINTRNYGTTTITASTSGGKTATCALRVLSDGEIIKFEAEKNGDTANVHIETGIVPAGAVVYIAAYDRDGVMVNFTEADLVNYIADASVSINGARKLKAFVWDPKTLAPLTQAKEINI